MVMKSKKIFNLIFEDTPPLPDPNNNQLKPVDTKETYLPSNISLDQKVDRLIMQYERESSPSSVDNFMTKSRVMPQISDSKQYKNSFEKFLFEADDMDLGSDPGMDLGGDSGGGMDMGGLGDTGSSGGDSDKKFEPPVPTPSPKLNLNNFAGRVATLIQNYDTLIDPRTVILNRVQAYMNQNYSKLMSDELMVKLERDFGLSKSSKKYDEPGPSAIGAGASGLEGQASTGGSITGGSSSGG